MDNYPKWFWILDSSILIVLFLFTIVTFILYFIEIQIVFSYRKTTFKGPFYRLLFVGIIVDIISVINMFMGQVVPAQRWFEPFLIRNQNWLGSVFLVITYGGRCIQGATAAILSFCRVCAVCFPIFYRKLGEPCYLFIMQAIQLGGGVLAWVLLGPDLYEYILEDDGLFAVGSEVSESLWFFDFAAVMEVVLVIAIIVNNVITYVMFRMKFKKKVVFNKNAITPRQMQSSQEKQKRESGLDKMTFIVCFLELVYFAFVVYSLQINQTMNKRTFYFYYNILCVIYSTVSAWTLLIFSKPINLQVREKFSKLSSKKVTRSISISAQGVSLSTRDNNRW
ncbi:Serpentine Receptor, class V [Caenorhabditis elegans]|uniref:Serpentine Receptor, class V n=1 Tax=Caenorhabditis elegans TaxID=6239 RepID=Q9XVM5_CAEEL|nr:Serpentine Receptor, class V [Caenorhabditis elegans]CAB03126.1 Serpentine Receptor, class V [Caenorhabditis elegans]|eukprot:NP_506329.1 Serpentine Receptor, class V [Caenorhabditis elegans]